MSKMKVPGLFKSTGSKPFTPVISGRYTGKITAVKVEPAKNGSPCDVVKFTMSLLDGPEQEGGPVKGRRFYANINLMRPEHPDYEQWGQIGVDELKSACLCFGLEVAKGDGIDPDAFLGQEGSFDVALKSEKDPNTGEARNRNNVSRWVPAAE